MKKSVLFVFPPGWVRISPMAPLGISEILATMEHNGIECKTIDLEIECYLRKISDNNFDDNLLQRLTEPFFFKKNKEVIDDLSNPVIYDIINMLPLEGISLVAFSVMGQRQWASATRIAARLKRDGYITAVGGCYVSLHINEVSASGVFDYAFPSLSLKPLIELIKTSKNTRSKKEEAEVLSCNDTNPSICSSPIYPSNTKIYRTALADMYKTDKRHLVLQYRIDRGCSWNCSFCVRQRISKYTNVPIEHVINSLAELSRAHDTKNFALVTNAINISNQYAKGLFYELARANLNLQWYAYATPCKIDPEIVKNVADSGCRFIRLGIESGSDSVLKMMRKGFRVFEAEYCLRQFHDAGIWTQVNIIFGFPNETDQDAEQTYEFIRRNHKYINSIRINPFYLQPGSDLYDRPNAHGIRIIGQDGKRVAFDEITGRNDNNKLNATLNYINNTYKLMKEYGIGYSGCIIHANPDADSRVIGMAIPKLSGW